MEDKASALNFELSRMEIEGVGANPDKLAAEIHRQLKSHTGRVPVRDIAHELDILEIRSEHIKNFEGAILMTSTRSEASILVNAGSRPRRQRFTIAHELCHFLNLNHKPRKGDGFWCAAKDVYRGPTSKIISAYERQEIEANRFASALLMPRKQLPPFVDQTPSLEHVMSISDVFDVSKQAAAHRYVDCRDSDVAIAISQNGKIIYWVKPKSFPRLKLWNGDALPMMSGSTRISACSDIIEMDPSDWLDGSPDCMLNVQTLWQANGYAMTMVEVLQEEHDTDELEDSYERFSRFS